MCGIVGTKGFGDDALVRAMAASIAHRGPDGDGFFDDDRVHLGNRRLAIQDVAGGTQPMFNEDRSVVVVYNGEIYNYPALRDHVLARGHTLTTRCDTEVLPHLYEEEGISFARHLNGIFAFALYDRTKQTLFLVRDPLGVKPVVYATVGDKLAFGSEAKAVLTSGLVGAELDETSLHLTMNVRYIPGGNTMFRGIERLLPGHVLEAGPGGIRTSAFGGVEWAADRTMTESSAIEGIRHHYTAAVRRQLLSDVPVGVSLSGGIDSSSIVAIASDAVTGPLRTFSLGFDEPTDELEDARFVAHTFGTDHHDLVLHEPALRHMRDAIRHTEEPKVNSLQLYLLHRYIGEHVKVVLSGLGGDELFAGYDFYSYLAKGRFLRNPLVRAIGPTLDFGARALSRRPSLDLYTRELEFVAAAGDHTRAYLLLRNAWDFNAALIRRVYTPAFAERLKTRTRDLFDDYFVDDASIEVQALHAEFATKMMYDLLHNEDTMSMAHSVESRVPLLDLELVRFAATIPDELRFAGGLKGLLKKALAGIVPDRVLTKPKWGFTVDPVLQYRKDLRPMAEEYLSPDRLRRTGIFNPDFVRDVLRARPHNRLRWHYFMLWQMIGVELWNELFVDSREGWTSSSDTSTNGYARRR